jgi:hypothetical protein
LYSEGVLTEEKKDFEKTERAESLLYWVVLYTEGTLKGLLHICRQFKFCKDVVVFVSEKTRKNTLNNSKKGITFYYVVVKKYMDLGKAFELLSSKYWLKKVLTGAG